MMLIEVLQAKIHGATITESNINYLGSITIDATLLKKTGLLPNQKVTVANYSNGYRWDTYIIEGKPGSGCICVNGVSARFNQVGDRIIILAYCSIDRQDYYGYKPVIVFPNEKNLIHE
jgi:aspartate 1-decarboxylase